MVVDAEHIALVLAAGGSRRLEQPKQLLRRHGETLIHRAARLCRETSPRQVYVVLGAHEEAMRAALVDLDVVLVHNRNWSAGLSSSLSCFLQAIEPHSGSTLIVGCDQPALDEDVLHVLLRSAHAAASGCAAVLHQGLAGIPAVVSPTLLQSAATLQGDRGLGSALRMLPREHIALIDVPALVADIDEIADLHAAIAAGWIDADCL